MLSKFRPNQIRAIEASVKEDFASGVHFHATGSGKSHIALQILASFFEAHPTESVMWICEQKSILIDQFDKQTLTSKGFRHVLQNYLVLDYTQHKQHDWTNSINVSKYWWNKPALVIINRAFLTSSTKYENIKLPISLILHDECHSIQNTTTQAFYSWMTQKFPTIKCIGFSATPNLHIAPFTRLISKYSIYDSVCDGVIMPPRIVWVKSTEKLTDLQYATLLYRYLQEMPYAKCVIWCGMIKHCYQLADLYRQIFKKEDGWLVTSDTSHDNSGYDLFYEKREKALLFCAAKHREGSDIPNLDTCVFLDRVEDRSHKVFVQCIGRVLRKDTQNAKKEGLIIDFKAKSSINICNRVNTYLNDSDTSHDIFPWEYVSRYVDGIHENTLKLIPNVQSNGANGHKLLQEETVYSLEDLQKKFVRKCPDDERYQMRVELEWALFQKKRLVHHLLQSVEILALVDYIPHVTRGSCGSSLLCYLLGISNVDPVKYDISFARFLNEFRESLPDIDFDFPHQLRDEVFLKLQIRWPGQIARISNHNFYHEKSAQREALRRIGKKGFMSKEDVPRIIEDLGEEEKKEFDVIVEELDETFRHYSLHCGGIVFFPEGVPKELLHQSKNNTNVLRQVVCNKADIGNDKRFKVDILSSRGLSQLHDSMGFRPIDFDANVEDTKTRELLCAGDNVGITLAESPLMRKAFLKFQPKSVEDVAKCLAIIRPAAHDAKNADSLETDEFIFDDDAISLLTKSIGCTEDHADKIRRKFSKGIPAVVFKNKKDFLDMCKLNEIPINIAEDVLQKLRNLRKYSFCKSHAYSYGQLVWQLAYMKANHPLEFWRATLHHSQSSYKRWVHLTEAWDAGCKVNPFNQQDRSVHSVARRNKIEGMSCIQQLQTFGCWDLRKQRFPPDCGVEYVNKEEEVVVFSGIFAAYKRLSKTRLVCTIGIDVKKYVEVLCIGKNKWMKRGAVGIEGHGKVVSTNPMTIETDDFHFY